VNLWHWPNIAATSIIRYETERRVAQKTKQTQIREAAAEIVAQDLANVAAQVANDIAIQEQRVVEKQAIQDAKDAELLESQQTEKDFDRYQCELLSLNRRFNLTDATLGILALAETIATFYLFQTFGTQGHWTVVLCLTMVIALITALIGILEFTEDPSLDLVAFNTSRAHNRNDAISTGLTIMTQNYQHNLKCIIIKNRLRIASTSCFGLVLAMMLAYAIGFIR
jgi:hypothetical protein